MKTEQNKDILESIKNYSNEILTLEDFITAVRQLPGMYLTGIGNRGFLGMFREVLQNAFDELNRKMINKSPCDHIIVYFEEGTNISGIEDNGRGIPFDKIIDIFYKQHTSSNYNKELGAYTAGKNGVGTKITNALSTWFTIESYILGEARKVDFIEGYASDKGIQVIKNKDNKQGTKILFKPSYEVMGEITVTPQDIINLLELLVPLTPIGSIVDFVGIDINKHKIEKRFISEDGIITYLIRKTVSPLIKPIVFFKDNGTMRAEIAFTYNSSEIQSEDIIGFGNFCYTSKGTHLQGFVDGLCKYFRDYMNKIYLVKNNKISIIDSDIKTGLKAAISVAHLNPQFIGQDKDELDNKDMYGFVKYLTINSLEEWSKNNPNDLQKICKFMRDVAEVRIKSDEGKIKLSNKYKSSALSGLPSKYEKPSGKEHLEFVIMEGDSALGSGKNSRARARQGLFPVRGKIPNAFTTTKKDFLNNEEVSGIIAIVNGGWGKSFDISKVIWEKVIFMPDADKDGCHIANLLLKFFLLYMRPMIEDGRVYRAVPPLYGAKQGKKYIYFTNKLDFVKYTQKIFLQSNTVLFPNGKKLTELQIMEVLFRNVDFTYELERIANRYAINPYLLELICLNVNNSSFSDLVKKTYRFVDVEKKNRTLIISGLIDSKYQTIFINDHFINDIKDLIDLIEANQFKYYLVNNNIVSIYSLMKLFEKSKPDVNRYKGLGEMNSLQLADSTLHPDGQRTIMQYTLADALKEIEEIRYLESNKYELIRNATASRSDILG